MTKALAVPAVILTLVLAGCAKQPATTQASAPSPGGATGSGLGGPGSVGPASARPGDAGRGMGSSGATAGSAGARPAVKDFQAVSDLADIHFDFDKADIRETDAKVLDANAVWLKAHTDHLILIEGHCDERGTSEYNTSLGDRRAKATMNYLVSRGVPAARITVISYGEER
ncbi:MAG TPA: OmpA family protein, partial [Methylomirabilota bacterium]|nr:OmpA family protein [Methylomirabilota bacterium]